MSKNNLDATTLETKDNSYTPSNIRDLFLKIGNNNLYYFVNTHKEMEHLKLQVSNESFYAY